MKTRMVEWVGGIKNLPSWFSSGEDIDLSFEQLKEIYDTGNNIMLVHSGETNVLFVDNKRFTQR